MEDKQRRFAEEYITDYNATQAAIRAGYSEKTAYSQGNRLLKNTEVIEYIEELKQTLKDESIADAKEVLKYLTSVMRGEASEEVLMVVGGDVERLEKQVGAKDRIKAAENLGKRYNLFNEKVKLEGTTHVKIIDNIPGGDD